MAWFKNKKEPSQQAREEGLKCFAIDISGGVAQQGYLFEFYNFIKLHAIISNFQVFVSFPDIQPAAYNDTSIFKSITGVGGASPGSLNINISSGLIQIPANFQIVWSLPLIIRSVQVKKISSNPNMIFYYQDYIGN